MTTILLSRAREFELYPESNKDPPKTLHQGTDVWQFWICGKCVSGRRLSWRSAQPRILHEFWEQDSRDKAPASIRKLPKQGHSSTEIKHSDAKERRASLPSCPNWVTHESITHSPHSLIGLSWDRVEAQPPFANF